MRAITATILFATCIPSAFGDTDPSPHRSPDRRFLVRNIGDTAEIAHHFEIQTRDGQVLFTSEDQDSRQRWTPTHAEDILWSSNCQFVLLRYHDGKYDSTALYSFADRKFIDFSHVPDGWTVPVRWVGARTFVVEESGPHGGKALGGGYHLRRTYRIRLPSWRIDCVYTGPTITEPEVPYAPLYP